MRKHTSITLAAWIAGCLAVGTLVCQLRAEDAKEDAIESVMKTYHKAPKGVDPVCKKAAEGKASPEEIKKLITAYTSLTRAKPPKGDEASWKEKTGKLLAAAKGLKKGTPESLAEYKEAVNCKACHSVHKPE